MCAANRRLFPVSHWSSHSGNLSDLLSRGYGPTDEKFEGSRPFRIILSLSPLLFNVCFEANDSNDRTTKMKSLNVWAGADKMVVLIKSPLITVENI